MAKTKRVKLPSDIRYLCPVQGCGVHRATLDEIQRHVRSKHFPNNHDKTPSSEYLRYCHHDTHRFDYSLIVQLPRSEAERRKSELEGAAPVVEASAVQQVGEDESLALAFIMEGLNINKAQPFLAMQNCGSSIQQYIPNPEDFDTSATNHNIESLIAHLSSILPSESGGSSQFVPDPFGNNARNVLNATINYVNHVNQDRHLAHLRMIEHQRLAEQLGEATKWTENATNAMSQGAVRPDVAKAAIAYQSQGVETKDAIVMHSSNLAQQLSNNTQARANIQDESDSDDEETDEDDNLTFIMDSVPNGRDADMAM